jgi:hypothetical protein
MIAFNGEGEASIRRYMLIALADTIPQGGSTLNKKELTETDIRTKGICRERLVSAAFVGLPVEALQC